MKPGKKEKVFLEIGESFSTGCRNSVYDKINNVGF